MAITTISSYTYQCVLSPSPVFRTVQAEVARGDGLGATSTPQSGMKMQEFHAHVLAAGNLQGFVKIPRNMPVGMKIWFFLKRPASDFVSRRRGENRLRPEALSLPSEARRESAEPGAQ